jgi:hypothetical protein
MKENRTEQTTKLILILPASTESLIFIYVHKNDPLRQGAPLVDRVKSHDV